MTAIERLRAKRQEAEAKTARKKGNPIKDKWIMKMGESGTYRIRLVPFHGEDPFIHAHMESYDVTGSDFLVSPITYGNPSPIDEAFAKLQNGVTKDEWKVLQNKRPSSRTFAPVIVKAAANAPVDENDPKALQFISMSNKGADSLYARIEALYVDVDEDTTEETERVLHDLNEGYDILFDYVKAPAKGQFPKYNNVRLAKKPTKATESAEMLKRIENLPTKEDLLVEPKYEQLLQLLEAYMPVDAPKKDVTTSTVAESVDTPSVKTTKVSKDMFNDIDDLLN